MSGMKVGQRVTLNFKGRSITATVVKIEPSEQVTATEVDDFEAILEAERPVLWIRPGNDGGCF